MPLFHIFDAVARDHRLVRVVEGADADEYEYMDLEEEDDASVDGWKKKNQSTSGDSLKHRTMQIYLFGATPEGDTVRIEVYGFRPYFFLEIPESYATEGALLRTDLAPILQKYAHSFERKKKLYGFTGNEEYTFLKLSVPSLGEFYELRKKFLNEHQEPIFKLKKTAAFSPLRVYESNLDPMLRFFHERNIAPCGWVNIPDAMVEDGKVECTWDEIHTAEAPCVTAPLLVGSWDIECYSSDGEFPLAKKGKRASGDPIIQIGTVCWRLGSNEPVERHVFVLGGCDPMEGVTLHVANTEASLLQKWFQWVTVEKQFDILIGYNIFGFDERYVWDRMEELGMLSSEEVEAMARLEGSMKLQQKFLSSSALGDNMLHLWNTPGRLRIDLYGHIKRKTQMASYTLDSVCAAFLSGTLAKQNPIVSVGEKRWLLKTMQKGDARIGRSVQVLDEMGEDLTEKMKILEIVSEGLIVESDEEVSLISNEASRWAVVKDDISPKDIFRLHRGTNADRAVVASYCVQDCDLVLELFKKLDVFNEAMSMANVCSVPVSYIFVRGQGIKIESLIYKYCRESRQLIEILPSRGSGVEDSYEGAIVLDPVPGFYRSPVGVCDFASLYPSTIISENISHDMLLWTKDYALDGTLLKKKMYGTEKAERTPPSGTRWTDIEFDIWRPDPEDTRKHPEKKKVGTRLCRYAQPASGEKGSLPNIVAKLLAARKAKREELKHTTDPFKKALLDAEQNAYKITANSLYGQLGSGTFKIRLQDLAASVTSYGRKQILFSKAAIERFYGPDAKDPRCSAEIVYGDTDSIFVNFNPRHPVTGELLQGRDAIVETIKLTTEAGKFITGALKAPHDFEYDKVFAPFLIFSKKRYVGNKYEESPDEFKETAMGIVLKRRDNAPILKVIYSAAIDRLLNHQDVEGAVNVVKEKILELVEGKIRLSQLTITKSLRSSYTSVPAHKMLADRIAERDPGNAPASGDRIGYVYIQAPVGQVASKLQGERVETPDFIEEKGLKPDAQYYIEHQLMNPLTELFSSIVEKIPGFVPPEKGWEEDAGKRMRQREWITSDLLFREGLQRCKSIATHGFLSKFGSNLHTTVVKRKTPPKQATKHTDSKGTKAKLKQTTLQFVRDTSLISDEALAKKIRSVRRSAKLAKVEGSVESIDV